MARRHRSQPPRPARRGGLARRDERATTRRRETDRARRATGRAGYVASGPAASSEGHRAGRQDRRAEPLEGERGEQAHAVDLGLRLEPNACASRVGVEVVAEAGAVRLHQQRLVGQLREIDGRAPGQGVTSGATRTWSSSNSRSEATSGWLTGRFTTARSRLRRPAGAPERSWWRRSATTLTLGYAASIARSSGASQRPVVPMMPSRTDPGYRRSMRRRRRSAPRARPGCAGPGRRPARRPR